MQRQRALADPAFARADSDEMTHAGESVGDAAALLGNLLEDSGTSIANDVVVALHFCGCVGFDSLHRRSCPRRGRGQDRQLHLRILAREG